MLAGRIIGMERLVLRATDLVYILYFTVTQVYPVT